MVWKEVSREDTSVTASLKRDLKKVHDDTEVLFMAAFVKKRISLKTYTNYVAQLYYVYAALEEEIEEHKEHDFLAPLYFPDELFRTYSLEQDLECLLGADWKEQIHPVAGTAAHVQRIHDDAQTQPELLLAHAHVRYMGDVSGGQIMKPIIRRMFKLSDDATNFYNFEQIASIPKFKAIYSSRMNDLDWSDQQRGGLVEEARKAFAYTGTMLSQILEIAEAGPDGFQTKEDRKLITEEEIYKHAYSVHKANGEISDTDKDLASKCIFARTSELCNGHIIPAILGVTSLLVAGSAIWYRYSSQFQQI